MDRTTPETSNESIFDALRQQGGGLVEDLTENRRKYLLLDDKYEPKDWNNELLTGFVGRIELDEVWDLMCGAAKPGKASVPGIYISGPPGAGKSSVLYFCVIKARKRGVLAPYVARCDNWAKLPIHRAKGFFIDIVRDANDAIKEETRGPLPIPDPKPIDGLTYSSWEEYCIHPGGGEAVRGEVNDMFDWVQFQLSKISHPVILFFDEQNGLYEEQVNGQPAINTSPYNLADFSFTYKSGCVALGGTTDTEFLFRVKGGYHRYIFDLKPLGEDDIAVWLKDSTQFHGPIAEAYRSSRLDLDEKQMIRDTIAEMTGRVPRELREFCRHQTGLHLSHDDDGDALMVALGAVRKAYEASLGGRIADIFNKYLQKNESQKGGIMARIFSLCTEPKPDVIFDAAFTSLGLIQKSNGEVAFLTPTTRDVLFAKTMELMKGDPFEAVTLEVERLLWVLMDSDAAGGEKGYAFEKFVLLRLMQISQIKIVYDDLSGMTHSTFLKVRHQIMLDANKPRPNWTHFRPGTLVAYRREGKHRFDFVYYGEDGVTFLETTVSCYWETKVPKLSDTGMLASILGRMKKWVGERYFDVVVESNHLVAKPAAKRTRSTHTIVPAPTLRYIVLSPRGPHAFQIQREEKYGFIGVSYGAKLTESGLLSGPELDSFNLAGADELV
ncbi:hypothetical protein HK097_010729 [Rhizophlyctis rosea]|uniref:Uncharacterized protein n=1 Tax=Rhizophlyctis rosea TaxID=64517 RepID=A0AAD5S9Y3_9FUNG|nr:hypothetical protein HK097_010729 [Rhizophlyctis rosea]